MDGATQDNTLVKYTEIHYLVNNLWTHDYHTHWQIDWQRSYYFQLLTTGVVITLHYITLHYIIMSNGFPLHVLIGFPWKFPSGIPKVNWHPLNQVKCFNCRSSIYLSPGPWCNPEQYARLYNEHNDRYRGPSTLDQL